MFISHTHISWLNENLLYRNYICCMPKPSQSHNVLIFPQRTQLQSSQFWQILTQKLDYTTNFLEEVAETPNDHSCEGCATSQQFDPPHPPESPAVATLLRRMAAILEVLFYCIGEIIGLRSFYSYFSGRAKEERKHGLKRKRSISYFISKAWPAFLKEPLRCGFKRKTLCGTGVGSEP